MACVFAERQSSQGEGLASGGVEEPGSCSGRSVKGTVLISSVCRASCVPLGPVQSPASG